MDHGIIHVFGRSAGTGYPPAGKTRVALDLEKDLNIEE